MDRHDINPQTLGAAPQSYNQLVAVRNGTTIYLSGQLAVDAKGMLTGIGDLQAQTVQVFNNLERALAAIGATLADLVKTTFFVVDYSPDKLAVIDAATRSFVTTTRRPASTLIGVQALAHPQALIEVEAVAMVPDLQVAC